MTDNLERAMALLDDVASGISATDAYQRGRIAERLMIVAWLRDDTGETAKDLRRLHANKRLSSQMTREWEHLIALKAGIADAIERGDHLT
jgi:hypothetical protein